MPGLWHDKLFYRRLRASLVQRARVSRSLDLWQHQRCDHNETRRATHFAEQVEHADSYFNRALLIALGVVFLFTGRIEQKPDLDPQAVVAQVRRLNQLSTVRYTVQKVIGIKEQKQPIGEESILLVMQARVEAGIDLASLREQDIFRRPMAPSSCDYPPPES